VVSTWNFELCEVPAYLVRMFERTIRRLLPYAMGLMVGCATSRHREPPPSMTTVYVVRHAEKAGTDHDTPLSPAGFARAEALAVTLADAGVDMVFATSLQRTQQTVRPLAERIGVPVRIVEPLAIDSLLGLIRTEGKGHVILVAGHNNTVPRIAQGLTGQAVDGIPEHVFDRLYRVDLPAIGEATLKLLPYGEPTP